MANRQIAGLTAEGSLDTTFVIPVQVADGSVEAKKVDLEEVKTAFGITEPIVKTVKVSLSSAEILALFTTTKELVPAVAGKVLIIRQVFQKYTHVSSPYTSSTWRIGYNGITFGFINITPIITSADNSEGFSSNSPSSSASGATFIGLPLVIGSTVADPTGGDGTLDLYVTYYEIDIT